MSHICRYELSSPDMGRIWGFLGRLPFSRVSVSGHPAGCPRPKLLALRRIALPLLCGQVAAGAGLFAGEPDHLADLQGPAADAPTGRDQLFAGLREGKRKDWAVVTLPGNGHDARIEIPELNLALLATASQPALVRAEGQDADFRVPVVERLPRSVFPKPGLAVAVRHGQPLAIRAEGKGRDGRVESGCLVERPIGLIQPENSNLSTAPAHRQPAGRGIEGEGGYCLLVVNEVFKVPL